MTCIAGLVHEGAVYISGDSAGTDGPDLVVLADEKVFKTGPFAMPLSGAAPRSRSVPCSRRGSRTRRKGCWWRCERRNGSRPAFVVIQGT
jgi:hypothetical protein